MLKSKSNGKVIVGQTNNFFVRLRYHFYTLRKNIHRNIYLQRHFNKYGEGDLYFELLEITQNRNEREVYWIQKFEALNPEKGFNIASGGDGHVMTSEMKERIKDGQQKSLKCQISRKQQAERLAKQYCLKSPSGKIIQIINLRRFCRENNLNRSGIQHVLYGRNKSYKGWTLTNLDG